MSAITRAAAKEAIRERLGPALESLEDHCGPRWEQLEQNIRDVRRAVVHGRHATEDFVAETALEVRRHPWRAVAVAAGMGALVGGVVGCVVGTLYGSKR